MLTIALRASGAIIGEFNSRMERVSFSRGKHGDEECSFEVPISIMDSFLQYSRTQIVVVEISFLGRVIWIGRVEDPRLNTGTRSSFRMRALGMWRALTDQPYNRFWSASGVGWWAVSPRVGASERFVVDIGKNSAVRILPKKGAALPTLSRGEAVFKIPINSTSQVYGIECDVGFQTLSDHSFAISSYNEGLTSAFNELVINGSGAGVTVNRSIHLVLANPKDWVSLAYRINSGTSENNQEDGNLFIDAVNVRVVGEGALRVAQAITIGTAGTNVLASVSGTTNMYVGQRLRINPGLNPSESAVILRINSPTTITLNSVASTYNSVPVRAFVTQADQIIRDIVEVTNANNPQFLSDSIAGIQSSEIDIPNANYQNQYPDAIVDTLAGLGDSQDPPRRWEAKVWAGVLYYQPRGGNRIWFVYASDLSVEKSFDDLYNSAYGTFTDGEGRTQVTTTAENSASQDLYDIRREVVVDVNADSSGPVAIQRDVTLQDLSTPTPRSSIRFRRVFTAEFGQLPLSEVRDGDTIVVQGLWPFFGPDIDRVRTFRIARTQYDVDNNELVVEPESLPPELDFLLARVSQGVTTL